MSTQFFDFDKLILPVALLKPLQYWFGDPTLSPKDATDMKAWLFLLLASVFQAGWTFSLKFLDFGKLHKTRWVPALLHNNIILLGPLMGYIIFGLLNSYFLSVVMKTIPASIAIAVWLGLAVISVKLGDVLFFNEGSQPGEIFFVLLIIIGVVGLKLISRH